MPPTAVEVGVGCPLLQCSHRWVAEAVHRSCRHTAMVLVVELVGGWQAVVPQSMPTEVRLLGSTSVQA